MECHPPPAAERSGEFQKELSKLCEKFRKLSLKLIELARDAGQLGRHADGSE
jgi:hypothetical protein